MKGSTVVVFAIAAVAVAAIVAYVYVQTRPERQPSWYEALFREVGPYVPLAVGAL